VLFVLGGACRYRVVASDSFAVRVMGNMSSTTPGGGEVDVRLVLTRSLDRRQRQRHDLVVVALDAGRPPLSGSVAVTVHVDDVQPHPTSPRFDNDTYLVSGALGCWRGCLSAARCRLAFGPLIIPCIICMMYLLPATDTHLQQCCCRKTGST